MGLETSKQKPELVGHIDGGARGNPGPGAYAAIIKTADGQPVVELAQHLGETTNNVAEYEGLLAVLQYAVEHKARALKVLSDSELLVRQIQGEYRVRSNGLKPLFRQAMELITRLESFTIVHVRREQNREADRLVNRILDAHREAI